MKGNNTKKKACQWCGNGTHSYHSILIPAGNKNLCVCLHCYNKEISKSAGIDYEDIQLHPIVLKDTNDVDHEFHFSLRLMGDRQMLRAFEVDGEYSTGYEFSMVGETVDGIFHLFSSLYERMIKTLSRKHIFKNAQTMDWQISGENTVRGQISCTEESIEYRKTPMAVIDGKEITWDDFGQMLMSYEGFNFKLQIFDQSDEMD